MFALKINKTCPKYILSASGYFWQLLAVFGTFWLFLEHFGYFWHLSGNFLHILAIFRKFWQVLALFGPSAGQYWAIWGVYMPISEPH